MATLTKTFEHVFNPKLTLSMPESFGGVSDARSVVITPIIDTFNAQSISLEVFGLTADIPNNTSAFKIMLVMPIKRTFLTYTGENTDFIILTSNDIKMATNNQLANNSAFLTFHLPDIIPQVPNYADPLNLDSAGITLTSLDNKTYIAQADSYGFVYRDNTPVDFNPYFFPTFLPNKVAIMLQNSGGSGNAHIEKLAVWVAK